MRPTPAGRGGTARCCSPYNAILERLDTMDARIQQAVDDANAAMSAAVIQAGNAAQSASDALTQAGIAAGKASDAAADAADAAQDAADAAQALSDINDTIGTILNSTLGDKVDKLTTAGLHLYSHTGATQGEEEPIDGTTSNTIPIRDGNGRMQAADPASGATDKTLTTANWVSQTGDSSPNNLMHRSGNETFSGNKTSTGQINGGGIGYIVTTASLYSANANKWKKGVSVTLGNSRGVIINIITGLNNNNNGYAKYWINRVGTASFRLYKIYALGNISATIPEIKITYDNNSDTADIWFRTVQYNNIFVYCETVTSYGARTDNSYATFTASTDTNEYNDATGNNVTAPIQMVSI